MPCEFDVYALDFQKVPFIDHNGLHPYTRYMRIGMPRIPDEYPSCAFYLYEDSASAKNNSNAVGTGFFVSIPDKNYPDLTCHLYAVTNWHVAIGGKGSTLRINTLNGEAAAIESDPADWIFDPEGHDIAVLPLPTNILKNETYTYSAVSLKDFITKESLPEHDIGLGDDVFMIGLFVDHNGGDKNTPTARFGNISMMPTPMIQKPSNKPKEAYCLDLHSRSGYSGSPVFMYRTPFSNLSETFKGKWDANNGAKLFFLGVHYAQFGEKLKVTDKNEYIDGLSGMTCVSPSWALKDLLMKNEKLIELREKESSVTKKYYDAHSAPILESNHNQENQNNREDFNNLLDAVVRGKP